MMHEGSSLETEAGISYDLLIDFINYCLCVSKLKILHSSSAELFTSIKSEIISV